MEHRKGSLHGNADGLSRRPHRKCIRSDCPDCTNEGICASSKIKEDCIKIDETTSFSVAPLMASHSDDPPSFVQNDTDNDLDVDPHPTVDTNLTPNWLLTWSEEQISAWQKSNVNIKKILDLKSLFFNKPPKQYVEGFSYECRVLWSLWESLKVENDILYHQVESEIGEPKLVLVAPKEVRNQIFHELHENRTAGHLGRDKTLDSVKRRFYWPGISKDIASWVRECSACARCKSGPGVGKAPLKQSQVGYPLDRIAVDIVGPCPVTEDGNEYIIVVQDYFTKWVEAYSTPNHTALTVGDKLATEFFCRFGVPTQLHSDQGREFESDLFSYLCSLFGIEKTRTCPYRPQSDGLVERMNRTLKQMLSIFTNENRNNWDDHLPYLLMAYRATIQDSTGVTPHKMMFGREMQCPLDIIAGVPVHNKTIYCPVQYIEWIKHTLELTYSFACEKLSKAASRQKKHYDRGVKPRSFSEGEFVWRWYPPHANIKFGLGWIGPYLVKRKITCVTYQIQRDPQSKDIVAHVDHLKPFNGREIPEIWQMPNNYNNENESIFTEDESNENVDQNQTLDVSMAEFNPDNMEKTNTGAFEPPVGMDEFNPEKTPDKRTRCGRQIHKPRKYSP